MAVPYLTEYFMLCGLPVIAIKAPDGTLAQAWAADKNQGRMRRDPRLLDDIESDSRLRPMLKADFDRYCGEHKIDSVLPENVVLQTIALISRASKQSHEGDAIGRLLCPAM